MDMFFSYFLDCVERQLDAYRHMFSSCSLCWQRWDICERFPFLLSLKENFDLCGCVLLVFPMF